MDHGSQIFCKRCRSLPIFLCLCPDFVAKLTMVSGRETGPVTSSARLSPWFPGLTYLLARDRSLIEPRHVMYIQTRPHMNPITTHTYKYKADFSHQNRDVTTCTCSTDYKELCPPTVRCSIPRDGPTQSNPIPLIAPRCCIHLRRRFFRRKVDNVQSGWQ